MSLYFSDKQTEDRPKIIVATSNVDLVPQETPPQEVADSTEGSAAVARGILGCQSVLVVSTRVLVLCCQVLVLTVSW